MTKTPTQWQSNPEKTANLTQYSSSTVTYNSSATAFSNANAALPDVDKNATQVTTVSKNPSVLTPVSKNPSTWNTA